jgi:predicted flap endonuclease-1-like 5' DNA nuclease
MLFTTFPQVLALLVLFVAGLFVGLGLHPGGAKWKKRFKDESDNYAAFRRVADKAQRESSHRIGELEGELATLRDRVPATTEARLVEPTPVPITAVEPAVVVAPGALAAEPKTAASNRDLSRIRSIDPVLKTRLFSLGVTEFSDIENLTAEDEMALEQRLGVPAGYITREQWREQAHLFRTGQDAEQAERFPPE